MQAKNTVFEKLNDELIIEKLDFSKLEEMFKLAQPTLGLAEPKSEQSVIGQVSPGSTTSAAGTSSARKNTLLDTKRLQNVGEFQERWNRRKNRIFTENSSEICEKSRKLQIFTEKIEKMTKFRSKPLKKVGFLLKKAKKSDFSK